MENEVKAVNSNRGRKRINVGKQHAMLEHWLDSPLGDGGIQIQDRRAARSNNHLTAGEKALAFLPGILCEARRLINVWGRT